MGFASYNVATRCTGRAAPGARALMRYVLASVDGARSLGIYSCRPVRGGGTRSIHSEGRALDIAMPMVGGKGSPEGMALVELLRTNAGRLGIQCIIYNRRIWSARSPGKRGRRYRGVHPHYDHLHVELTRTAGARLNVATARAVLTGGVPAKPKRPSVPKVYDIGARTLRRGARGPDVALLQRFIGVRPDDGIFGPQTEKAVRQYQRMRGLKVDGIVGRKTWAPIVKAVT